MTSPSPSDHNAVAAAQARAARGLLGWSQTKLAEAARVSLSVVKRSEASDSAEVAPEARARMRAALEAAGVEFLSEDSGGAGVRFRRRRARQTIAFEDLNASNDE